MVFTYLLKQPGPEVINTFFMLNSVDHEIHIKIAQINSIFRLKLSNPIIYEQDRFNAQMS